MLLRHKFAANSHYTFILFSYRYMSIQINGFNQGSLDLTKFRKCQYVCPSICHETEKYVILLPKMSSLY